MPSMTQAEIGALITFCITLHDPLGALAKWDPSSPLPPSPGMVSATPPPLAPHMSSSSTSPASSSLAPSPTALPPASPSSKSSAFIRTPSPALFRPPSPASPVSAPSSSSSIPSPGHSHPPFSPTSPTSRSSPLLATFSSAASPLPSLAPSASSTSPPTPSPAPSGQPLCRPPPTPPRLQLLNLSFNRLRDTLPPSFACLHPLLYLWLDWNRLEGPSSSSSPIAPPFSTLASKAMTFKVLSLSLSRKPPPLTISSTASTMLAHLETPALAINHKLVIFGGHQLSDHVHIRGSKNATLAILAGSLCYVVGPAMIRGMPNPFDTRTMATMLRSVGGMGGGGGQWRGGVGGRNLVYH